MPYKDVEDRKEYARSYSRQYYQRNRQRLLEKQKEKNRRHIAKVGAWLNEYKKQLSCARCSESHPATLQFHHRDPKDKEFAISVYRMGKWSKERILKEIAKCEVICANCHAKEHWSYLYE
jgi:hypothetical protein